MAGLSVSNTGLSYGVGLIYPIIPSVSPIVGTFVGAGSLLASVAGVDRALAAFDSGGSFRAIMPSSLTAAQAVLGGSGGLSANGIIPT